MVLLAVPVALGAVQPHPGQRIDLKVLVIAPTATDGVAAAWKSALASEGVPYDEKIVSAGTPDITDAALADYAANRALYQAVIVTWGDMPMAAGETAALNRLQTTFGIRRLSDNTLPSPDVGMNFATNVGEQGGAGKTGTLTDTGKAVFPYLQGTVPIDAPAFGYQATPASPTFTTLLAGPNGSAYLGIYNRGDGREEMVSTLTGDRFQTHFQLLRHGMLSWVTRGVYLGYERNYFAMQVDDAFMENARWDVNANKTGVTEATTAPDEYQCDSDPTTTAVPDCLPTIRMTPADVTRAIQWQNANGVKLDMAFNAEGSEEAVAASGGPDPLTDAFVANKSQFRWINHTYSHPNLNAASRSVIESEITTNLQWAMARGFSVDPTELVTGEHSGLDNTNMAGALSSTGVRWIASDNSRESSQRAIGPATTVPRYPTNVYYNVGTKAEQLDEYNYVYLPPGLGGKCVASSVNTCLTAPATWEQYVESEANIMFDHVMDNDPRPHYAHQSNVAEEGVLYPVMEAMLARYRPYVKSSLAQLSHAEIGAEMQRSTRWNADRAGISAYLRDGVVYITNTTSSSIELPLTGTTVGSLYGGQKSGWATVAANASRTFEPSDPANTAAPVITGPVAAVGGTLTATTGTWSGTPTIGFAFQWQRCDAQGESCANIAGATAATYQTQAADKDRRLRVVVSGANWISSVSQARSAATEAVAATPAPQPTDPPAEGQPTTPPAAGSTPPAAEVKSERLAPLTLSGLKITPTRFAVTGRRRGARLAWTVSDVATLRVTVERSLTGRRVAGACRASSRSNRGRPACSRFVSVGAITRSVPRGAGGLDLTGTVGGGRLRPGTYRLVVTATAADRSAPPGRVTFTVTKARG